jgi:hypothetical protein
VRALTSNFSSISLVPGLGVTWPLPLQCFYQAKKEKEKEMKSAKIIDFQ